MQLLQPVVSQCRDLFERHGFSRHRADPWEAGAKARAREFVDALTQPLLHRDHDIRTVVNADLTRVVQTLEAFPGPLSGNPITAVRSKMFQIQST